MRGGLRRRLALLVAAATLPLALYVVYQIVHLYDDLTGEALARTERNAHLVSVSVNRFVHQMVEQGQSVGLAVVGGGLNREEADAFVRSLGKHAPISNFTVLTPSGELLATALPETHAEDLASLPSFERVVEGAPYSMSAVRTNASGRKGFAVFAPVGEPLEAVVAVSVDAPDLATVVPIETGAGVILVTDAQGTLAYSSDASFGVQPGRSALRVPTVSAAVRDGPSTLADIRLPGLGERYAGTQVPVPEIGWTTGFYSPRSDVLRHVSSEVVAAVGSVLAILLVAGVLTRRFALGIVEPVDALTAASERLRAGDFDTPVDVSGPGEIGTLAEGFADMRASLRRTFASVTELAEAGRALNAALSVEEVARAGIEHLAALLHADAAVLTLRLPDDEVRTWGVGTDDAQGLAEELAGRIPDPELTRRPKAALLAAPGSGRPSARFLVSLPLVSEGREVGRTDVVATVEHGIAEFERADVELANGLAQQLAVSLLNARRFELERDIAETLQDALLTEPFPVDGAEVGLVYRPASGGARVGGDFYDLIRIDEERVAVVLGDISGHGLTAARHTMAAKGSLRSFALEDPAPASVLERANAAISGQLEPGTFVTVFYALLDIETGELRYADAGHPPPTLLAGADGAQSVLLSGDPPLGVDAATRFAERSVRLAGGDTVVAYTDGVTEARTEDGRFFGEEGVARTLAKARGLPAQQLAAALADEAERFGGRLADDVAVLVLERSGPTSRGEAPW